MRRVHIILVASVLVAAMAGYLLYPKDDPWVPHALITDSGLTHPGDIIKFKGRYVVTEIYANRLAVFADELLRDLKYFEPLSIGKRFRSPHFLAVSPWDTLLVSNGWGDSIIEIEDLDGNGWKAFKGVGRKLRAPHGICVDEAGWIYVGDSLNSRLVRFRDMDGGGWQVFKDVEQRISYIRELVCRDGAVWASNSYEKREGLNPGTGSNILRITSFESGMAEIIHAEPGTNMTGLALLSDTNLLAGLWGAERRLALVDTSDSARRPLPRTPLGVPYGTYVDHDQRRILVTYVGDVSGGERQNPGGLAVYRP